MKTLAERIRSSRLKSGLSQMELAEQTQLTQQMISKLESGSSQSTSAILAIAKALRVSAHWLWQGSKVPTAPPPFYDDEMLHQAWLALTDKQRNEICEYILDVSKDPVTEDNLG
jgi:transcriptional regulator with XRE-family HTH domain